MEDEDFDRRVAEIQERLDAAILAAQAKYPNTVIDILMRSPASDFAHKMLVEAVYIYGHRLFDAYDVKPYFQRWLKSIMVTP